MQYVCTIIYQEYDMLYPYRSVTGLLNSTWKGRSLCTKHLMDIAECLAPCATETGLRDRANVQVAPTAAITETPAKLRNVARRNDTLIAPFAKNIHVHGYSTLRISAISTPVGVGLTSRTISNARDSRTGIKP